MGKKEITILDYFYVFVKWRKLIIVNFIVICILTAAVSLVIPRLYRAHTTILPPTGDSENMGLSSFISDLPLSGFGLGSGSATEETNLFMAIVHSRTVMETIAETFDLQMRYKAKNMEETVRTLREHIFFEINEEGTITLGASAGTPYFAGRSEDDEARLLARDIANFIVAELDKVNKRLKTEKAQNHRIFLEIRYNTNLEDLSRAEEAFKAFQEQYGAVALPEQTVATISAAAELKAQMISKEIEIGVLETVVGKSHNTLVMAINELKGLESKYDEFIFSRRIKSSNGESADLKDLFLPLEDVPDLGLKYARLFREVMLQEKILEFILPQYEQAKIQEAKDTPTVQILDEAIPPIKRSRPKRAMMVIICGFLSIIMSGFLIFIFEYLERIKMEGGQDYEKLNAALGLLKRDFHFRKKR